MSTLQWPAWLCVNGLELRVRNNTRIFNAPYSNQTQVLELGGEMWVTTLSLPPTVTVSEGLAREAFFDRLAGGINNVALYHFKHPSPSGTFVAAPAPFTWTRSGAPFTWTRSGSAFSWTVGTVVLLEPVAAGANACTFRSITGRTVRAGDMVGINGELKRVLADATADGSGRLSFSFTPRARAAWPAYSTPIVTEKPTALFRIAGEVPTQWTPGVTAGTSFELMEVINP